MLAHLVGALFVCAVAIVVVAPWHIVHRHVPEWDGAGFVLVAQKIAQSFEDGLLPGLSTLYFERIWRPIIFPVVAAPFFMLASGNILIAVTLTQCACALVTGCYVYLFLRDYVGLLRATVGASFVISLAWFANYTHLYFWSEPFWIAATGGVLFHLSAALRNNTQSWHFVAAGIWLGLMMDVRPAETVALAALPIIILLLWAYRSGGASVGDLFFLALQIIAATAAVGLKFVEDSNWWVYLLLLVAALIVAIRARRFFIESPVLGFLIVAEAVTITWHLPSLQMLYGWAYGNSFGLDAKLTDQIFRGLTLLRIVGELLKYYSPAVLVALTVIAAAALAGWRRGNIGERGKRLLIVIALAAIATLPIFVLHLLSGTSDDRRVMPALFLIYVGMVALALLPGGILPRVRLLMVTILAALQISLLVASALQIWSPAVDQIQWYTGQLRGPDTTPDPNPLVVDGLVALGVHSGFVLSYSLCRLGTDSCHSSQMPIYEHMAVSTLARERRLPLFVDSLDWWDLTKPETLADQFRVRRAQYILVDTFDDSTFPEINRAHPNYIDTVAFIKFVREGFPPGFSTVGCFTTMGRPICVYAITP
jgi:hypothetical protein